MILRPRIEDDYDPELPWIVEANDYRNFMRHMDEMSPWVDQNVKGETLWRMRKVGFADFDEAMLFLLRFS